MPDVYGIDVIWPEILADEFVDLRTYIPEREIAAHFPELIASYSVKGKLVAMPYTMAAGALFYRVDLLRQYGYREPPKNWDQLEAMAARIQKGERAKGHADFWGYVWPGAPSEAFYVQCARMAGLGRRRDSDRKRNSHRGQPAFGPRMGEGGTLVKCPISPPGVVAYKEWDSLNLWQAGQPAFMRSWSFAYVIVRAPGSPTRDRLQIAPLPEGRKGVAATFAATGYGVSKEHPRHPREGQRCWLAF